MKSERKEGTKNILTDTRDNISWYDSEGKDYNNYDDWNYWNIA